MQYLIQKFLNEENFDIFDLDVESEYDSDDENDMDIDNDDDDIIDKSDKWTNEQLLEDMILIEDERQGLNYLAAIIGYKCKKIDNTLLSDKPINSSKDFKESYWFIGEYT